MTTAVYDLQPAVAQLSSISPTPLAEAERLFAFALGVSRSAVQVGQYCDPTAQQLQTFAQLIKRRANGEPFAYIVGDQPFRNLCLQVNSSVLIPRPETEQLVDWALEVLTQSGVAQPSIWDVCTGSGCIALSLASEYPAAKVWASDISESALMVAKANNAQLGKHLQPVCFGLASWLDWNSPPEKLDLIIANPPYIAENDAHLEDLKFEPLLALTSADNGLEALRKIIRTAPARLAPKGWLLLEHGYDQGQAVRDLLSNAGFFNVTTRRDYGKQERMTGACWLG